MNKSTNIEWDYV